MWRWIHPEKLRYYQAELVLDLFGEWTLVYGWGGLGTRRGRRQIKGMASKEEGLRQVAELDTHRQKRGYLPVESFADWQFQVEAMKRLIQPKRQPRKRSYNERFPEPDLLG